MLPALELLAGVLIISTMLLDVFRSVLVPGWTGRPLRFARLLAPAEWQFWRRAAGRLRPAALREAFLTISSPLALISMVALWCGTLLLGYGLALHALRHQVRPVPQSLGEAIYLAGAAFFTLGFGDYVPTGAGARVLTFAAAASGILVAALAVSQLFALYGSVQSREAMLLTLDARAGTPPSGVAFLETYGSPDMRGELAAAITAWEGWVAALLKSHLAHPMLPSLRSSSVDRSWVAALEAIMDAASLLLAAVEEGPRGPARLLYPLGCRAARELAEWYHLKPAAEELTREQFDAALDRLAGAGFAVRDADAAWQAFLPLRAAYAGPIRSLAHFLGVTPARWL